MIAWDSALVRVSARDRRLRVVVEDVDDPTLQLVVVRDGHCATSNAPRERD